MLEIRSSIERLADQPNRGCAVEGIRVGYRRYAIGSHLIYFIVNDDGVYYTSISCNHCENQRVWSKEKP